MTVPGRVPGRVPERIPERIWDRVIGGVFLLALAGLFLPMVFDGAGVSEMRDVAVTVPAKAVAPVTPMPTHGENWAFVDTARQLHSDGPLGTAESRERTSLGDPQPRPVDARSPTGRELPWMVQVASFTTADKADQLRARLLGDGIHAYVSHGIGSDKRPIVRVAVGPILERAEADRVIAQLHSRYGLDGILKRFDL